MYIEQAKQLIGEEGEMSLMTTLVPITEQKSNLAEEVESACVSQCDDGITWTELNFTSASTTSQVEGFNLSV